jgi:hypothetical protein
MKVVGWRREAMKRTKLRRENEEKKENRGKETLETL